MSSRFLRVIAELKRRRVFSVGTVYVVVGLGVLGAAEVILEPLGLDTLRPYIVVLVLLGFPIALVLAWAYEVHPDPGAPLPTEGETATGTVIETGRPSQSPEGTRSVAVLPFESMSAESGGDYFADGIAEELTNALAKQPGLRVAARTSAFAFKGERIDVREIGARLNVSHVIEGSVRRSGQTLRITAQLINAADGYHLWSQQFDRDLGDVFQIQEEIAGKVVEGLQGGAPTAVKPQISATKLSAYEAFLRGRHALATFGPQAIARAIEEFEICIGIDGTYAPAFAGLADALTNQSIGFSDYPPKQAMVRAGEAAQRALELDPELPEGHLARALVRMWHEFDFEGAKEGFDRALELNPNFADAYLWLEFYWTYVRFDFKEAVAANRKAFRLSPLDSRANVRFGTLQMIFGDLDEAETSHRQELVENPDAPVTHLGLGDTLFRMGEWAEGISHVTEAVRLAGRPTPWLGMLAGFLGAAGEEAKANEVFEEMKGRAADGYVSGFWMAVAQAGQSQFPEAFSSLERAVEERDSNLLYLFAVPRALGLHDRPEFPKLLNRIGLGHLMAFL
jgi:TolB-like protein/Flp pilus assembly protein TadD